MVVTKPHVQANVSSQTVQSSFLRLPAELRNHIYQMVLVKSDLIDTTCSSTFYKMQALVAQPALTKVCRQIRAETLPIFYGANVFLVAKRYNCIMDWNIGSPPMDAWFQAVGRTSCRRFKHLYIDYCWDVCLEHCFGMPDDVFTVKAVKPTGDVRRMLKGEAIFKGDEVMQVTFGRQEEIWNGEQE